MSDRDNLNNNSEMNNLVFDWKNPSMNTRPKTQARSEAAPEKTPEADAGRSQEMDKMVQARKEELLQQRREKAAAARGTAGRKAPARAAGRGLAAGDSSGKPKMSRVILKTAGGAEPEQKTRLGIGYRSPQKKVTKPAVNRSLIIRLIAILMVIAAIAAVIWAISRLTGGTGGRPVKHIDTSLPGYIQEDYLTVNSYSRPGISTGDVKGIVVHYTSNPGATAKETRDYFDGLAGSHETRASAHFIIGLEGEVLICVPLGELAYASNSRNMDTVSIECCHPDETGSFTQETYDSLVKLTKWLMQRYSLTTDEVLRHYDITGKMCPKYFVEDPDAWDKFLKDVAKAG